MVTSFSSFHLLRRAAISPLSPYQLPPTAWATPPWGLEVHLCWEQGAAGAQLWHSLQILQGDGSVLLSKKRYFMIRIEQMWELGHKECWAPKNWCFWTAVLEKTLESPLGSKEIKPIKPEYSLEELMLKLKLQYFATWCEEPTHWKRPWCWELT